MKLYLDNQYKIHKRQDYLLPPVWLSNLTIPLNKINETQGTVYNHFTIGNSLGKYLTNKEYNVLNEDLKKIDLHNSQLAYLLTVLRIISAHKEQLVQWLPLIKNTIQNLELKGYNVDEIIAKSHFLK